MARRAEKSANASLQMIEAQNHTIALLKTDLEAAQRRLAEMETLMLSEQQLFAFRINAMSMELQEAQVVIRDGVRTNHVLHNTIDQLRLEIERLMGQNAFLTHMVNQPQDASRNQIDNVHMFACEIQANQSETQPEGENSIQADQSEIQPIQAFTQHDLALEPVSDAFEESSVAHPVVDTQAQPDEVPELDCVPSPVAVPNLAESLSAQSSVSCGNHDVVTVQSESKPKLSEEEKRHRNWTKKEAAKREKRDRVIADILSEMLDTVVEKEAHKEKELERIRNQREQQERKMHEKQQRLLEQQEKLRKKQEDKLKFELKRRAAEEKEHLRILAAKERAQKEMEEWKAQQAEEKRLKREEQAQKRLAEEKRQAQIKRAEEERQAQIRLEEEKWQAEEIAKIIKEHENGIPKMSSSASPCQAVQAAVREITSSAKPGVKMAVVNLRPPAVDALDRLCEVCLRVFQCQPHPDDRYSEFDEEEIEEMMWVRLMNFAGENCFSFKRVGPDQYDLDWAGKMIGKFLFAIPKRVSLLQISRWLDDKELRSAIFAASRDVEDDVASLASDEYSMYRGLIMQWHSDIHVAYPALKYEELKAKLDVKIHYNASYDAFGLPQITMNSPEGRVAHDTIDVIDWALSGKLRRMTAELGQ